MRIVIDLQAAQSTGSRNRGIGRYCLSLAQAMVRNRGGHEILIALSGLFPETIEPIRMAFADLLPQENVRVWHPVSSVSDLDRANDWRRHAAEMAREAFLANLKPDIVHVTSMFEGLVDDAVTSVGVFAPLPTAVTLYDLIPLIHRQLYLDNPAVEAWYLRKLDHLRRADIWLAISESSRQEGLAHLNLPDDRVINISTAADAHFQRLPLSGAAEHEFRQKYGLVHPFVMYTGGIDHRKNIEGLIRAFSLLPVQIRREHQLAIVCSAKPEDKQRLLSLAQQQGLSAEQVVLTGFVPEDDLVALYNLCKLFVFPSWHEGFGLPALEAMCCGAPVIGANTSSLPEVIGWDDALFDPHSDEAIGAAMQRVLSDEAFRNTLMRHGEVQANKFSWDDSARRALAAFERFRTEKGAQLETMALPMRRPKLAYVSPLPPLRSGIADYSAELLPELARHYQVEVIVAQAEVCNAQVKACCPIRTVEWFARHVDEYDRVLYHFGNSDFHSHMFDLLAAIPGVVVLHDFFLSGIVQHMDVLGGKPGLWAKELYQAHGYHAVRELFQTKDTADVVWKYPCNLSVLQNSLGLIVHSENSRRLARQWYGGFAHDGWAVIPLMRQLATNLNPSKAKAALGFENEDFVVCSFGIMGPTKLNHRLLDAWLSSRLHTTTNCHLVFVGENHPADYGQQLLEKIRGSRVDGRVRITGWTDREIFQQYLTAADIGVQLRTLSRGETSAAALDCMNYGLATIVNANGSMADLPDEGVWKLPDEFTEQQLVGALETLWQDHARRLDLGTVAREIIHETNNPQRCADMYGAAIERYYCDAATGIKALSTAIADIKPPPEDADLIELAIAIAKTIPVNFKARQLLVDVSELAQEDSKSSIQMGVRSILRQWIINPPDGFRVEPVYATKESEGYHYARRFALDFLDCPVDALDDEQIEYAAGDIFLCLDWQPQVVLAQQGIYQEMRRQGLNVKFIVYYVLPDTSNNEMEDHQAALLRTVVQSDGAICISQSVADELKAWLQNNSGQRGRTFRVDWLPIEVDIANFNLNDGQSGDANRILECVIPRIQQCNTQP